ncbi:MAG: hypothetical protein GEEBNDBF_02129 [bacterium]|nr:hypothetical protein [bacterium]
MPDRSQLYARTKVSMDMVTRISWTRLLPWCARQMVAAPAVPVTICPWLQVARQFLSLPCCFTRQG